MSYEVAVLRGPNAWARARRYAEHEYGEFDEIEPERTRASEALRHEQQRRRPALTEHGTTKKGPDGMASFGFRPVCRDGGSAASDWA
jgi:hypothetical protein